MKFLLQFFLSLYGRSTAETQPGLFSFSRKELLHGQLVTYTCETDHAFEDDKTKTTVNAKQCNVDTGAGTAVMEDTAELTALGGMPTCVDKKQCGDPISVPADITATYNAGTDYFNYVAATPADGTFT